MVTYYFEKRLTKRLTWDDARRPMPARPSAHPDIAILKDVFFEKPIQNKLKLRHPSRPLPNPEKYLKEENLFHM